MHVLHERPLGNIGVNLFFAHVPGVLFGAKKPKVANDPIAVGLFGAVGVMMIRKYQADLIRKL